MNDPACCTQTCYCRSGYPENRKVVVTIPGPLPGVRDSVFVHTMDDEFAARKWRDEHEHPCQWQRVMDCVQFHYPGGWPSFVREVIEK